MTATTATDPSGVEYFFACTAGGGNDSAWQDSPSYTDINLQPSTQYSYHVQARDKSGNQNATGWSSALSATTDSGGDGSDPNLIAHWKFDETSGTTAADSSGNGHTGTLNNGASFVAGMHGNAVEFDGENDYIRVSDSDAWDFSGKEVTLALWFKADPAQPKSWPKLVEHRASGQYDEGWHLTFDAEGDHIVFRAMSVGGTNDAYFKTGPTYDDGTWHHVTVTLKDGMAKLYMDGAFLLQHGYDVLADEDDTLWIGAFNSLKGQIDDMRIYDRALNAAEIATLADATPSDTTPPSPDPPTWATAPNATGSTTITMAADTATDPSGVEYLFDCTAGGGNDSVWQDSPTYEDMGLTASTQYTYRVQARDKSSNRNPTGWSQALSATTDSGGGGSDPNLIAHWKFDETSGTTAADSSGNGHTGTLNNGASFVAGMHGNAVEFDGANDYIRVPDSDAWDFSGKEVTLALWFKADPAQPKSWPKLVEHRASGQYDEGWHLTFDAEGDHIVFRGISVGGTNDAYFKTVSTYDDGTWHHVTVTLADGMAKLYMDGAFLLQDGYDVLADEDDILWIGAFNPLKGQIDDTRIYDRALSAAEVATLAGVPDPEPLPGQGTSDWTNISYTYDAAGRRITKDVDGVITKYIYDGDHVIAEYDGADNLLRRYIYGPGTDNPICMIEAAQSDAKYYYHRDGLGNVVALSNEAGNTVQTYEYTIYGQVAASDPNHPNPYMFTGRRFEPETGLYYYRARIYNPYMGRFLQTDPIGYSDGINWYRYCGNNPGNGVDPSGMIYNPGADTGDGIHWMDSDGPSGGLTYLYDARVGEFYELFDETEAWVNGIQETWSWNKDEIASNWLTHADYLVAADFEGYGSGYVVPEWAPYEHYWPWQGSDTPTRGDSILISSDGVVSMSYDDEQAKDRYYENNGAQIHAELMATLYEFSAANKFKPQLKYGIIYLPSPTKITKDMWKIAQPFYHGRRIRDVEHLVARYGGEARYWKKFKTWDKYKREIHYYFHKGIGAKLIKWGEKVEEWF